MDNQRTSFPYKDIVKLNNLLLNNSEARDLFLEIEKQFRNCYEETDFFKSQNISLKDELEKLRQENEFLLRTVNGF